ncbi:MAG: carboxylating nicotinate-nucleotide diphosphorylase [Gammaproteobacteria bacterium]|nr:carboxylating nicotinate-nucleotide diphosphorylase [Gammaproteobacteria bacterium]
MPRAVTPPAADIADQVAAALAEDIGSGDLTASLIPQATQITATLICRQAAILCGSDWLCETFRQCDNSIDITAHFEDGDCILPQATLFTLHGPARAILSGERTALNFIQTLSATATTTANYVAALKGYPTTLLDTRKTIPGLRLAQKYAVACGGGSNHRIGLFDALLIKENHILAAGSITAAINAARKRYQQRFLLEVEVETLTQLDEAIAAHVDRVLLDNMDIATIGAAVARSAGRVKLEASGGVTLKSITALAATGVDYISVGSLTKGIDPIDLSLRVVNFKSVNEG